MSESFKKLFKAMPNMDVKDYMEVLPLLIFYQTKKKESAQEGLTLVRGVSKLNCVYNGLLDGLLEYLDGLDKKELAQVNDALEIIDELIDESSDVLTDLYLYCGITPKYSKVIGAFFTPTNVASLLSKLTITDESKTVYDPTSGMGSLLLEAHKLNPSAVLYGQEVNRRTAELSWVNMYLHDLPVDQFNISVGDVLETPHHLNHRFDVILGNPPFSYEWNADDSFKQDPRFVKYQELAPNKRAEYNFIQHMLYHLSSDGSMAVVMPHGALFRGGAEERLRTKIINDNLLDAVIGLPAKLFYGTDIPTIVMIFKKNRSSDDVLFIDASELGESNEKRWTLTSSDIDKIVDTYNSRAEVDRFSHNASLSEIIDNDYNLNIPRFVDTFVEEEQIDYDELCDQMVKLEIEDRRLKKEISKGLEELGLRDPFKEMDAL